MEPGDPAEPGKFFPEWMRKNGPSNPRERGGDSSRSRSRRGDSSPSALPAAEISLKLNSSESSGSSKDSQRRSSGGHRGSRGYPDRFPNRSGAVQNCNLFLDASGGNGYGPRSTSSLSRSFSEGHGRSLGQSRSKRDDRELTGGDKDAGKNGRRHHRSVSTKDSMGLERDLSEAALHREKKEVKLVSKDVFDKNFPTLGEQLSKLEKSSRNGLGQASSNSGKWISRLAEQPSTEMNGNGVPHQSTPMFPTTSSPPLPPARMADAVQAPVESEYNIMADKQRLEKEQSRRLIPVIANPTKAKNGVKAVPGSGRRGEHRDMQQLFTNMVSAAKKMEDQPKQDTTLVIAKRTSLPQNQKFGDSTPSVNGLSSRSLSSRLPEKHEAGTQGQRARGPRNDANTQEKTRSPEDRLDFFNSLKRLSVVTPAEGNVDSSKRTKQPNSASSTNREVPPEKASSNKPPVKPSRETGLCPCKDNEENDSCKENGIGDEKTEMGMCGQDQVHGEEMVHRVDDSHLLQPSPEEEKFLISMGWSANDKVTLLTEEEISAWRRKKKPHSSLSAGSLSAMGGTQTVRSYSCTTFHIGSLIHHSSHTFLVGSDLTTSDSDSM